MRGWLILSEMRFLVVLFVVVQMFFMFFVSCCIGMDDILEIKGPAEAFEGDVVEFVVTLNGDPVRARVSFGNMVVKYSNESNGRVNFTMPHVSGDDRWYTVTVSFPGGLYAVHDILVKNATDVLEIELPMDPVLEMHDFVVTILVRDEPVAGAYVWFNSSVSVTNSSGNVILTAPDVLVTTNCGIYVNKTGYRSNSTMVTIHDVGLGVRLMEVVVPCIVEPGKRDLEVDVVDENGFPLGDVMVEVYYEDKKYSEYTTDTHGRAYVSAPEINDSRYFLLTVSKPGYDTVSWKKQIKIFLLPRGSDHYLNLELFPSEVYEGEEVVAEVSDENGVPVKDVSIWKGCMELEEKTDTHGILVFIAPSVFMDKECFVYAVKDGYNFAEKRITIRNHGVEEKKLRIDFKKMVNETEYFDVRVLDMDNNPVEDATVVFNSVQKFSDSNGSVVFLAPSVEEDTFYVLEAYKQGYLHISSSVQVIDLDNHSGPPPQRRELYIYVRPRVLENEVFTVIVKDENNYGVPDVSVKFMDTYKTTDYQGVVNFTAPDVSWDTTLKIVAAKAGYQSSSKNIVVKNRSDSSWWYVVLSVVVVIMLLGVTTYFRYGQYRI
ncbi:MAG: hypothetical protein DRN08_02720 [Thermoplasmata archaeon]|nr:MAG: hypothetical protein DRN08_02720 [Thermoplasmata archaeon]